MSSRRRNFSSRRWTDTSSATARGAVCGASNSESAAADEREEGVVAVLSAEEDPLQPLPEPEILIIGRAIKRV